MLLWASRELAPHADHAERGSETTTTTAALVFSLDCSRPNSILALRADLTPYGCCGSMLLHGAHRAGLFIRQNPHCQLLFEICIYLSPSGRPPLAT